MCGADLRLNFAPDSINQTVANTKGPVFLLSWKDRARGTGTRDLVSQKTECRKIEVAKKSKWTGAGSNRRHMDFQSIALPTELPVHWQEKPP